MQSHAKTQKITRQVHATHHENTLDTRQVTLALTIPSGAAPEFTTIGIKHRWVLRVALLTETLVARESTPEGASRVAMYVPPPHLEGVADDFAAYHTSYRPVEALCGPVDSAANRRDAQLEIVECAIPVVVYPNASKSQTATVDMYA